MVWALLGLGLILSAHGGPGLWVRLVSFPNTPPELPGRRLEEFPQAEFGGASQVRHQPNYGLVTCPPGPRSLLAYALWQPDRRGAQSLFLSGYQPAQLYLDGRAVVRLAQGQGKSGVVSQEITPGPHLLVLALPQGGKAGLRDILPASGAEGPPMDATSAGPTWTTPGGPRSWWGAPSWPCAWAGSCSGKPGVGIGCGTT